MSRKLAGLIVSVSDMHGGGSTALMPPTFTTEDGQRIQASRWQGWLWEAWTDLGQQVKAYRRKGAQVFIVVNGDITEGNHHETTQLLTADEEAHAELGVEILDPLLQHADGCVFVKGTGVHAGKMAGLERKVANQFRNRGLLVLNNNQTHFHFKGEVFGLRINAKHHTRGGTSDRLRLMAQMTLLDTHVRDSIKMAVPHADYLFRAHIHHAVDTLDYLPARAMVTGCWQLPTEYVHKMPGDDPPHIAAAMVRVYDDGTHDAELVRYPFLADDRSYPVVKLG